MQIPTPDETNDNVVAYWVPDTPPAPGQPLDFAWRHALAGRREAAAALALGRADAARPRRRAVGPGEMQFIVDFVGGTLDACRPTRTPRAVVDVVQGNARLSIAHAFRNPTAAAGACRCASCARTHGRPSSCAAC